MKAYELYSYRKSKGVTQAELAAAARLNCGTLADIEHGRVPIMPGTVSQVGTFWWLVGLIHKVAERKTLS